MEATSDTHRRLYKSRQNRIIDGICGGIAEYFGFDPTIVRLLWVLVTFLGGTGFFLYLIAMIIMPVNPNQLTSPQPSTVASGSSDKKRFWGVLLILIGAFILLINLGWIAEFPFWAFSASVMLPILLIILGLVLMYTHTREKPSPSAAVQGMTSESGTSQASTMRKELRRSPTERKLFGVCGGLGQYFNIDPTIVRIVFVFIVLASFGWGLLIYILLAILMPEEKPTVTSA